MTTHAKTIIFVSGILLGIVCGQESKFATEIAVGSILLMLAQVTVYFFENKNEREIKITSAADGCARYFYFPLITILLTLGLSIGIVRYQFVGEVTPYTCATSCTFKATIVSSPEIKNEYQVFTVEVITKGEADFIYDVQVKSALYPKYRVGEILSLTGKVTIPSMAMPHTESKNSARTFDYGSYLHTKNIGSEMFYPKIEVLDSEVHTLPLILMRWKESLVLVLDRYLTSPASMLASGMLFGSAGMSTELLQTFRAGGLSHIIVLSGFNIVIVISSILFVLKFLPLFLRIMFASASVLIFVAMVGASPSVVRAVIMAFISLLALLVGRSYVAKQALILSLLFIVLYDPSSLTGDASLHLSFLATMGLVYLSEPISMMLKKYCSKVTSPILFPLITTTLAAYFSTLPYVMYTFGSVSIYALIANILVVPLVPLAMLLSFFVVTSSYVSGLLSVVFGLIDSVFIDVIIYVARVIERLPFSTISITVSFEVMIILYLIILVLVKYIHVSFSSETKSTRIGGNLTDIISY